MCNLEQSTPAVSVKVNAILCSTMWLVSDASCSKRGVNLVKGTSFVEGNGSRACPERDTKSSVDRRRQIRFPIALKLRFSLMSGLTGEGMSIDISRGGAFFRCAVRLPVGKSIELAIDWPCLLNGDCPLQLRLRGQVVRSGPTLAAMVIQKWDFRTAPRKRTSPDAVAEASRISA